MLESIGILTILAIACFLFFSHSMKNEDNVKQLKKLIWESDACRPLVNKMRMRHIEACGKDINRAEDITITKELLQIINQPGEKEKTLEKIRKHIIHQEKRRLQEIEREKIAWKYKDEILEMFDIKRELDKDYILDFIKINFIHYTNNPNELFAIWEWDLISKCLWNKNKYQINNCCIIYDERNTWLEKNNKVLEPRSKEEDEYKDDLPF